jgi:uncharacterized protein (TIGR02646 family)
MMRVILSGVESLTPRTQRLLTNRQAQPMPINVQAQWKSFRATKACDEVASTLSGAFHGKCAYCENIEARDIEHFYPKSRYPDRMFRWENFLWSCKNCNTEKLATFPLSAGGEPVLLNPTLDDPLDFFRWDDLSGKIVPHPDATRAVRATRTRDLL